MSFLRRKGRVGRSDLAALPSPPPPEPDPEDVAGEPLLTTTIPLLPDALQLQPNQALDLMGPANPQETVLLIHDRSDGPWRAVLLPPGSVWQLTPKPAGQTKPGLWLPPGSGKPS